MSNIVKICKKHGKLDEKDIIKRLDSKCFNCRICSHESTLKSRLKHRQSLILKAKKYREENKEKRQAYQREYDKKTYPIKKEIRYIRVEKWRKENPDKWRDGILRRNFGISLIEYNEILLKQNNVCSICKKPEKDIYKKTGILKNLAVDHCHNAELKGIMKIRGLLCASCNNILGRCNDSIEILESAIEYLRKHE